MLRNLNNSYTKMGKLQEQLASGSKLTRPSDDPVAAVKGMGYRTTLDKNEQYTRNMNEVHGWLETTDTTLTQTNNALTRVKDLVTQAASDTLTSEDRLAIQQEIDQIRLQLRDVANTQQGERYIFSGTDTTTPLFADSSANATANDTLPTLQGNDKTVEIEVYDGIKFEVNSNGKDLFSGIDAMMQKVQQGLLPGGSAENLSNLIKDVSTQSDKVLQAQATVGAKSNRMDTMMDRLSSQNLTVTKQLSNNEDIDYEKSITDLITEQSIHQAALSVGSKIIQRTLVDFL